MRKFKLLKYPFFENVLLYCQEIIYKIYISRNSLQIPSLDEILLGNFKLSNSVILVEDVTRSKRGFEIF